MWRRRPKTDLKHRGTENTEKPSPEFRSTLGWFNLESRGDEQIPINEQVEVLALVGNVAVHENEPKLRAHVVVGKRDGTAHGGHLLEARVRPTLEVTLIETPAHLRRRVDKATGLPLIAPDSTAAPPRRGRPVEPEK